MFRKVSKEISVTMQRVGVNGYLKQHFSATPDLPNFLLKQPKW